VLAAELATIPPYLYGGIFVRIALSLIWFLCCPVLAMDDSDSTSSSAEQPPLGLLEFLGELEPVDEETWKLLEQNALKDVAKKKEVSSE
jgi:hypothetical protein